MQRKRQHGNDAFIGPIRESGFRKRARKYIARPRHSLYNKSNDLDTKFCVLKKHINFNTLGSASEPGDTYLTISCAELGTAPQWAYFSNLFNRYKLEWIKVTIHQGHEMMCMYSFASLDSVTAPSSTDETLKHQNVRVHDTTQDRYAPSRTLDLKRSQAFSDYLNTSDIGTDLGTVSGVQGSGNAGNQFAVVAGSKKAMIGIATKGSQTRDCQATLQFGVRFRGLNDAATVS
jgi:hypothetical protein